MKTNYSETEKRAYWTSEDSGIWHAHYQPLNPKTKTPWQASRRITAGHDCYRVGNWNTKDYTAILSGELPPFEVWTRINAGMNYANAGFSSEALALAAIAAEKEGSGK